MIESFSIAIALPSVDDEDLFIENNNKSFGILDTTYLWASSTLLAVGVTPVILNTVACISVIAIIFEV